MIASPQTIADRTASLRSRLDPLRDAIFAGNDNFGFVEREAILGELGRRVEILGMEPADRYCRIFAELLDRISTPVDQHDVFLGRMIEGDLGVTEADRRKGKNKERVSTLIGSVGHGTLDYQELLAKGLDRIVAEAEATAERLGTDEARAFARHGAACATALRRFTNRYAAAARSRAEALGDAEGAFLRQAADALEQVPHGPARNLFEALHSMWMVHFVMSCVVGARDLAFGRMDQYLLPYLEQDQATGVLSQADAELYLAHFLLKNNEITGLSSAHYLQKPTPCQGTRVYIVLAGSGPDGADEANRLSELILTAATHVRMPEPILNVRFAPATAMAFKRRTAELCPVLQGQIAICNDAVVIPGYAKKGVPAVDACTYTLRGCSSVDLGPLETNMTSVYNWLRMPVMLHRALQVVRAAAATSEIALDDIYRAFAASVRSEADGMAARCARLKTTCAGEAAIRSITHLSAWEFAFESLLLRDCVARGLNATKGGSRYTIPTVFCAGIATVGNALMAIQRIVYEERRMPLAQFLDIVERNYEGHEEFRQELVNDLPKFGNDEPAVDAVTRRAAVLVADTVEAAFTDVGLPVIPGFYSLFTHHWIGVNLSATPDGRRAGEPISENQSPVYGTDTRGMTALLKSVAQLPFDRCFTGSLNLRFGGKTPPEVLVALVDTYFRLGGVLLGMTFADRATLQEARVHPEQYRTLFVRQYGFSEYFTALPVHEQEEFIKRTEH
jgi:formate C-acetyltransferase